mmetsp:Transcript_113009/g.365172  ORF Transcript_113009/g.365172 Transcript_113009/m.365172 type:complete len:525 (+) Transcript_113009:64-1638(+)
MAEVIFNLPVCAAAAASALEDEQTGRSPRLTSSDKDFLAITSIPSTRASSPCSFSSSSGSSCSRSLPVTPDFLRHAAAGAMAQQQQQQQQQQTCVLGALAQRRGLRSAVLSDLGLDCDAKVLSTPGGKSMLGTPASQRPSSSSGASGGSSPFLSSKPGASDGGTANSTPVAPKVASCPASGDASQRRALASGDASQRAPAAAQRPKVSWCAGGDASQRNPVGQELSSWQASACGLAATHVALAAASASPSTGKAAKHTPLRTSGPGRPIDFGDASHRSPASGKHAHAGTTSPVGDASQRSPVLMASTTSAVSAKVSDASHRSLASQRGEASQRSPVVSRGDASQRFSVGPPPTPVVARMPMAPPPTPVSRVPPHATGDASQRVPAPAPASTSPGTVPPRSPPPAIAPSQLPVPATSSSATPLSSPSSTPIGMSPSSQPRTPPPLQPAPLLPAPSTMPAVPEVSSPPSAPPAPMSPSTAGTGDASDVLKQWLMSSALGAPSMAAVFSNDELARRLLEAAPETYED